MGKKGRVCLRGFLLLLFFLCLAGGTKALLRAQETGEPAIEFYYENVCASCEGDKEFFSLYQECLTKEEKETLQGKAASYNIFLDSCKEQYQERRKALGIPKETSLPVLIIGNRWVSGLEEMEELLHEAAAGEIFSAEAGKAGGAGNVGEAANTENTGSTEDIGEAANTENTESAGAVGQAAYAEDAKAAAALAQGLEAELQDAKAPVSLLFTTESCEDCERVKEWLDHQGMGSQGDGAGTVLECNIIQEPWVDFLKSLFQEYGIEERRQQVPALFIGDRAWTGAEEILELEQEVPGDLSENKRLLAHIQKAEEQMERGQETGAGNRQSFWTLAGAGLLAGFNPCSISMLLMLLSMVVAEKASVWKNGLLYLAGKYAAYIAIGMAIYVSASELDAHLLSRAGHILNVVLILLFAAAGVLYLWDAVRVYRQEYGEIRTQLPTGMRKWNHKLIRRAGAYTGVLKPLLIAGLGMAISVGEFFCTGQIYMASITYLLKDQVRGVWVYFLVYVTAMSLPAVLMLMVIQKTRNTEHISEFMLRHMGAVKIFNAVLFFGYAVYFLLH